MRAGLSVQVLSAERALGAFTPEWDQLAEATASATVFQTSGWYLAWIHAVAAVEGAEPVIALIRSSGRLRAAVALQMSLVAGSPALLPLSSPWADYHDALAVSSDTEALAALGGAIADLAVERGCSILLDDLVSGGILEAALRVFTPVRSLSSPVAAIDLTDEAHLARVMKGREHAIKWRRLNRAGDVACRHHSTAEAIKEKLPALIQMHRRQWANRAEAVAPFDGGTADRAFEAMVRHMAPLGHIVLTEFLLDERPTAAYFGFFYKRVYGGYRTAFDPDFRRLSPGHLMLRRMLTDFAAAGIRKLDLMRGAYEYKAEYANRAEHNTRLELRRSSLPH